MDEFPDFNEYGEFVFDEEKVLPGESDGEYGDRPPYMPEDDNPDDYEHDWSD